VGDRVDAFRYGLFKRVGGEVKGEGLLGKGLRIPLLNTKQMTTEGSRERAHRKIPEKSDSSTGERFTRNIPTPHKPRTAGDWMWRGTKKGKRKVRRLGGIFSQEGGFL